MFLFIFIVIVIFFSVKVYERDTSLVKKRIDWIGWDHRAGSPRVAE